jgi:hypothetical protein
MELIGFVFLLFLLSCIVIATLVSAIFIWFGAKVAGIDGATFIKSFWAALVSSILVWLLTGLASALFGFGSIAGWILGLFITLAVLKIIFDTTWGKAFLTWLFQGLAQLIVLGVVMILVVMGVIVLAF